ncbi:MAG: DUF4169 family protein [Paracoccaceae bacterium]|nr:DUF4169 family protein [Paracoccaceae bacterium]
MTNNIVNLNQVRKAAIKDKSQKLADANAVKFGRTKMQKVVDKAAATKSGKSLDGHKRERDE